MSNNIFEFSMSNDLTLEFLGRANYKTRFCFNKNSVHRNRYALLSIGDNNEITSFFASF